MSRFVAQDLLEALADPRRVAGLLEGSRVKTGEAVAVERVLEMLKGESELQDLDIYEG